MLFTLVLIVVVPFFVIALILRLHRVFKWDWLEKILSRADALNERRRRRYIPLIEILFIPVIALLVYMSFRNIKPDQPRFDNRIAVLADSTDLEYFAPLLSRQFEQVIRTPQPEKQFRLEFFSGESPARLSGYNYLIVLAPRPESLTRKAIIQDLGLPADSTTAGIRLLQRNTTQGSRLVIAGWAPSPEKLSAEFNERGSSLSREIQKDALTCRRGELFTTRKEAAVSRDLLERFGWSFTKQGDLQLVETDEKEKFAAFSPWSPGRYMFVHWVENGDTAMLTPEWMIRTRNRLCESFYDSTYVDSHFFKPEHTEFLGRKALVTRGLWADDNPVSGGPFTNYLFYDPDDRRIYMVDVFVFRPGQDKLPYLQPLEVIVHTFITAAE